MYSPITICVNSKRPKWSDCDWLCCEVRPSTHSEVRRRVLKERLQKGLIPCTDSSAAGINRSKPSPNPVSPLRPLNSLSLTPLTQLTQLTQLTLVMGRHQLLMEVRVQCWASLLLVLRSSAPRRARCSVLCPPYRSMLGPLSPVDLDARSSVPRRARCSVLCPP